MHISFYRRPLFLLLAIYAAGVFLFAPMPAPRSRVQSGPGASVEAAVISFPSQRRGTAVFEARVLALDGAPQNFKTIVNCPGCSGVLRGQKLALAAQITPIEGGANFGGFNEAAFYARKHIFTRMQAQAPQVLGAHSRLWLGISKVRGSILDLFYQNLPPDLAAIIAGITIGERGDLPRELYEAFQDSGAVHLLVASGGNVGFAALIAYFICSLLGLRRVASGVLALALAGAYALIAGGDTPLMRAYLMTALATIGFLLGRASGVLHGLCASAFIILLLNPQALFEASFQMSFLATGAIVLLVANFSLPIKKHKIFRRAAELFLISLAAQLALVPAFTNYFYKISFTAAISNVLLVPLSGILMAAGFFVWALSWLHIGFLLKAAFAGLQFLLVMFKIFVEFFAAWPISNITAFALKPLTIAAYLILLFAGLNLPVFKRKFWFFAATCAALFAAGIFTQNSGAHILQGRFSKALLAEERGRLKLIGAGVQGDILRKAVLASGHTRVECLFLSGLNASAVYGLVSGLEGIKIKNIYAPAGAQQGMALLGAPLTLLEPGQAACGVEAQMPWYFAKVGGIFVRRAPEGNLSYSYGDYRTAGSIKDIISAQEMRALSLI